MGKPRMGKRAREVNKWKKHKASDLESIRRLHMALYFRFDQLTKPLANMQEIPLEERCDSIEYLKWLNEAREATIELLSAMTVLAHSCESARMSDLIMAKAMRLELVMPDDGG